MVKGFHASTASTVPGAGFEAVFPVCSTEKRELREPAMAMAAQIGRTNKRSVPVRPKEATTKVVMRGLYGEADLPGLRQRGSWRSPSWRPKDRLRDGRPRDGRRRCDAADGNDGQHQMVGGADRKGQAETCEKNTGGHKPPVGVSVGEMAEERLDQGRGYIRGENDGGRAA